MKGYIRIPKKRERILRKDKKLKEKIEDFTNTSIEFNKGITIDGKSFDVYQTKHILKAFGQGFGVDDCLYLLEDRYGLEIINLSDFTGSKKRLKSIKGRVIGTGGKTKEYIEKIAKVKIAVSGKTVGIIGYWDNINIAKKAIMKIIKGSRHQTVYRWLEQQSVSEWKKL